jgi:4-alpha-glucanotransferase
VATKQQSQRASGILMHPTSLPGRGGIGSLGEQAKAFIDGLANSDQQVWQLLPMVPTGHGESPYSGTSAFGGEPMLIDIDTLVSKGWLDGAALAAYEPFSTDRVHFQVVRDYKYPLLRQAWAHFREKGTATNKKALDAFIKTEAGWLDDFALYTALKDANDGKGWSDWSADLVARKPAALEKARKQLADEIAFHQFCQWVFDQQWHEIRQYANARGIRVLGDIPIFVAYDSADVWAHQDLFTLDSKGHPTVISGVPPDYFSETGQRWGNPLYKWDVLAKQGYSWWVDRFKKSFALYDAIRIDHFRGFEAYWEIPASEETAIKGKWKKGPGAALFHAVEKALGGKLPIVAEDLGEITPEVEALRDELAYPGMKILQFAFDIPANPFLPHNVTSNCVVYTGTHDNDTTRGWFDKLSEEECKAVQLYLGRDGHDIAWDLIRTALSSVADLAVIPMQDVLDLGTEARMNLPGQAAGNWSWRMLPGQWTEFQQVRLRELTRMYGRKAKVKGEPTLTITGQPVPEAATKPEAPKKPVATKK